VGIIKKYIKYVSDILDFAYNSRWLVEEAVYMFVGIKKFALNVESSIENFESSISPRLCSREMPICLLTFNEIHMEIAWVFSF
jgi:hypothetical protein